MKRVVDQQQIADDLRSLGIRPGMEVLVHSSLSSIGQVTGGSDAVIDALLETVDPSRGTILVPTLTGTADDGPNQPPHFDVVHSKCWTGQIPETFRKRPEAHRSLSPTHSVAAIGAQAANLTTGHEDCWTTCGYGSPYYRLSRRNGYILLLGVTLNSNTTFHTVEEMAGVSYHLQPEPVECRMIDKSGGEIVRTVMLHDWGTERRFSVMQDEFIAEGVMREGKIGEAHSYLIDSKRMIDLTYLRLQQHPNYLTKQYA